jgi:hypothetical protein
VSVPAQPGAYRGDPGSKGLSLRADQLQEDRWPSGAAGGMISKINPDFRQMHLLVSVYPYGELPEHLK